MVKESDRKKAYHMRAAHKPGCNCRVCKAVREAEEKKVKAVMTGEPFVTRVETLLPPEVEPVRLDSLNTGGYFNLEGKRYRLGEKATDCIVCHQLSFRSNGPSPSEQMWMVVKTVSLDIGTMVEPAK